jgi:hypothetical protein
VICVGQKDSSGKPDPPKAGNAHKMFNPRMVQAESVYETGGFWFTLVQAIYHCFKFSCIFVCRKNLMMMNRNHSLPFLLAFFILSVQLNAWAQSTPTWSGSVANIIYNNCSNCHNQGGIGPFPLMSYNDAVGSSAGINFAISNSTMPPWPADTTYRRFAHERVLTVNERQQLLDWLSNGMPLGNPLDEPPPPVINNGSALPQAPQLSVTIPTYTITSTTDIYRCFVIPSGVVNTQFIRGFEVIPGNRSVVHHVLVYQDTTGQCAQLDANDPLPGYTSFGGVGASSASLIGAWVPGSMPSIYPQGMGIRLRPNADIVLQIHYPGGVAGQSDSTKVNFLLSPPTGMRQLYINPIVGNMNLTNGPFIIQPNTVKTFHAQYQVPPINISLLDVAPHMHLLGKSISSFAVSPTQDTIKFIRINDWNFHWQGAYTFKTVQKIPANSIIRGTATYDNTTNNLHNPSNPPVTVTWGEGTNDEMFLIYFTYTPYQAGDEFIVQDSSMLVTGVKSWIVPGQNEFLYPNPGNGQFRMKEPLKTATRIRISDLQGKLMLDEVLNAGENSIDLLHLGNGFYLAELSDNQSSRKQKIIVSK